MELDERIDAFAKLGRELEALLAGHPMTEAGGKLAELMPRVHFSSGWYTEKNLRHRIANLAGGLKKDVLQRWIANYDLPAKTPKTVAVVLAGNIPLVGFDDFRCVLVSGNKFLGKLPSDDKRMLPLIGEMLVQIEPRFNELIAFEEGRLPAMDAVIATGSNNSSRYFEHYFGKYPHIIRRNRNGVAVLTGKETDEQLHALGEDIFRYFGLGCRSVTKLFVPEEYNFVKFFEAIYPYGVEMLDSNKYTNNYDYHKSLYLLSSIPLLDNNFLLLKEDAGMASPPGVVFYEKYESLAELEKKLNADRELIQCVVGGEEVAGAIPFGTSQATGPGDYADGVDVMKWLAKL
jgi:hypothetical protein